MAGGGLGPGRRGFPGESVPVPAPEPGAPQGLAADAPSRRGLRPAAAVSHWAPCAPWRTPLRLRRPLVVLLDTSESMSLPSGPGDASRIDSAREALAAAGLTRGLAGKYDLKLYSFDRETAPRDFDGLAGVVAGGRCQPAVRRPRAGGGKRAGRRRGRRRVRRHRQPGRCPRRLSKGTPAPVFAGVRWGAGGGLQGPPHRRPAHSPNWPFAAAPPPSTSRFRPTA